jgi:hypothetical protein
MKSKNKNKNTGMMRVTKKEKEQISHLINCGNALSNIVFNLAQHEKYQDHAGTMNRWRKEWDEAKNLSYSFLRRLNPPQK